MVVKAVSITGLFGIYSYEINIEKENQDLLLITGPNGYGKTTILSILHNLAIKNLIYFYQLPFDNISIVAGNETNVFIHKENTSDDSTVDDDTDIQVTSDRKVVFELIQSQCTISQLILDKKGIQKALRNIGYYRRSIYDYNDIMSIDFSVSEVENNKIIELIADQQSNSSMLMLLDSLLPTNYIHAQRLHRERRDEEHSNSVKAITTIEAVVDKLRNELAKKEVEYLKFSEAKDSKFIDTLLKNREGYSFEEYQSMCDEINNKIEELNNFDLIKSVKIPDYIEDKSEILSAYIDDLSMKFEFYRDTLNKLNLFSLLINKKLFANKNITYSPKYGLRITSSSGDFLDVSKLSSGEQNEIIMLYNFIFEVHDKSLLLIDEPEISLHVTWQQNFMNDIIQIASMKSLQVIIATHSPQIIGERWDKCYDLYEQYELDKSRY